MVSSATVRARSRSADVEIATGTVARVVSNPVCTMIWLECITVFGTITS